MNDLQSFHAIQRLPVPGEGFAFDNTAAWAQYGKQVAEILHATKVARNSRPAIARHKETGTEYVDVDWSTSSTGYVRVLTRKNSYYIVKFKNLERLDV